MSFKKIFLKQVATLLAGNGVAQMLTIAAAPLLTRIYSPSEFGALALFVALYSALSAGVCGRYDMAVIVAKTGEDKFRFVAVSLWFSVMFSSFSLLILVMLAAGNSIESWQKNLEGWIWMAPFALLLTGVLTALRAYASAIDEYNTLSLSAIVQAATTTALSIVLGLYYGVTDGQLYAVIFGLLVTILALVRRFFGVLNFENLKWNNAIYLLAVNNKEYPLYNASASVLNGVMSSLPILFMVQKFPPEIIGYYALLVRVGVVPLSFISDAVSRVNLRRISELINNDINPLLYLKKITVALFLFAAIPSVVLMMFAPHLFSWLFGDEWQKAGELLIILMPSIGIQFVVSTLSLSFIAAGQHKLQALWQVIAFITTIIVFAENGNDSVESFFWAYMIKDVCLYILYYIFLVYAMLNCKRR